MTEHMSNEYCCNEFDPAPWTDQVITWEEKLFIKDRVKSFFHIPLNFGRIMKRNCAAIEQAGAAAEETMVLSDENSLWGADVYIRAAKEVPGLQCEKLSGTYLTRVFEGPYKSVPKWVREMKNFVDERGKVPKRVLLYYTTCPKCAKKYGKNYVVILAEI